MNQSATRAIQWLAWADQDYLAARSLLLTGSLIQGAGLSDTAVEKYLKAIQIFRGHSTPHTHDVVRLYELTKDAGTIATLNENYLRALVKAYKLRYPDDLEIGFTLTIAQSQWLAELDDCVHALRAPFRFEKKDGSRALTVFDFLLKNGDTRLTDRNAAFGFYERSEHFAGITQCYDLLVLGEELIIYRAYESKVEDTGHFDGIGLNP